MPYQWLRNRVWLLLDRAGYDVRRKANVGWGADAGRDQQQLLADAPVRVIVDAGANVGDSVAIYRSLFPDAFIHAFEPYPDVYRQLAARWAADPHVRVHQAAVTDVTATKRFYVNKEHVTNSLLPLRKGAESWAGAGAASADAGLEVPTTSLDDFCARERIDRIDLLKLDIQGGEGMAIAGASRLLSQKAVRLVYTEVLFAPLYDGQASFCDLATALVRYGYQLFGLYHLAHRPEGLGWADAVFR